MHPPARTAALPEHRFLGASIRTEPVPDDIARWLADDDPRPVVHVSFGSFLSARSDVLARVVAALRPLPVRVALATGSADPGLLGQAPEHWLSREFLPQIAVLRRAAVTVTHGGNNSITEALALGPRILVLPFSTDQFAGAEALETASRADVLDPNTATVEELRGAVQMLLDETSLRPARPR